MVDLEKAARGDYDGPFQWIEDEKPHFKWVYRLVGFVALFWVIVGISAYLALR